MKIRHFTGILLILLAIMADNSFAQLTNRVAVDRSGSTLRVKSSTDQNLIGSPYLVDSWSKGNVKFVNAKPADNVDLKLDLLENVLVLKGADGSENTFTEKISEFTLNILGKDRLFKSGFLDSKNQLITAYFEVLYNGKTKFLSKEGKMVIESKGYNTSTITKKIENTTEYYISKSNNSVSLVKLNEKAILTYLAIPDLGKYVKDNQLNLKTRDDIIKLLQYHDSL
jgi:hypothetical protein